MSYRSSRSVLLSTRRASKRRTRARAGIETLECRALLSAGDLDGGWANGGFLRTDFGDATFANGRGDLATAVAVQDNGRIVTVGQSSSLTTGQQLFAVSRHFANGDVDTNFGSNGKVLTDFGANANSIPQAVAIDSLGRILVAGRTGGMTGDVLTIARYSSGGSLDTNFGSGGKVLLPSVADSVTDISLVIDDNDRPLIGFTRAIGFDADLAIVRLNDGGFLDGGFGGGGVTSTNVSFLDVSGGIALAENGEIFQAGSTLFSGDPHGHLITAKYDSDGNPVTSGYGNLQQGGVFMSSFDLDAARSVVLDGTNGSLLVAGMTQAENPNTGLMTGTLVLSRVTADGDGASSVSTGIKSDSLLWSMGVQRDGKILVAGDDLSFETGSQHYTLARFNGQLQLDQPFGDADGTADGIFVSSENFSSGAAVVADSLGQILVAGYVSTPNDFDTNFFLARHDAAVEPGDPVVTADANANENDAPYIVNEGNQLVLSGAGTITAGGPGGVTFVQNQRRVDSDVSGPGGEVVLTWDLDGDTEYDDFTGENPTLNAGVLDGPSVITVAVMATDASDSNNFAIDTAQVEVKNVAPNATINTPANPVEGVQFVLSATVQDVAADTFTYSWSITEGSNPPVTGSSPTIAFTPTDNGPVVVNLVVHDDDGGQVSKQATINVGNANPTVAVTAPANTQNEGTALTFSATGQDVAADTLSYEWVVQKDGQGYAGGNAANLNFTPNDNGVYQVALTVRDEDGGVTDGGSWVIQGNNVAPTPNITGDTLGVRGEERTLNLAATDPGAADVTAGFTFTIDWADGSPVQTVLPGTTTVNHTFANNGTYAVKVTAKDKDLAESTPFTISMVTQTAAFDNGVLTINGVTGDDRIRLFRTGGQVSVGVNDVQGGGQEFVQNYSGVTRVIVNSRAGDDVIDASEIGNIPVIAFGGPGNDKIITGNGADMAIGGDGDDRIVGTGGDRDVLIGGRGADIISGDSGEDILVGGYTLHDADIVALVKISDEWNSTRSYNQRIDLLHGATSGGLNGTYLLKPDTTTFDDGSVDKLTGGTGLDWFIFNSDAGGTRDKVTDAAGNELLEDVDLQP